MDPEKIIPDPGQLCIQNEFEVKPFWKIDKIWPFLNKNDQLKNINSFLKKKFPKKLKSRYSIQLDTFTRREHKGKIYVKNIRKDSKPT